MTVNRALYWLIYFSRGLAHPIEKCENQRMVDKLDTFAERLKFLRKKSGLSLSAVARQLGVTPQAVHKWENGGKVDNDREWALADLFKVSGIWLIRGVNSELDAPDLSRPIGRLWYSGTPTVPTQPEAGVYVPVLRVEEVEDWLSSPEYIGLDYHKGAWIACPCEHGERTFAVAVQGISMENLGSRISYSDGDIIFADPDVAMISGCRALFGSAVGSKKIDVVFRELIVEGSTNFWRPLNPQWPQAITPVGDRHIPLAKVIGKWVDEK